MLTSMKHSLLHHPSLKYCSVYLLNPLTACAAHNRPWRALAFLPLLTSSFLTKIGIVYAQLLQEVKIFPMMPISQWLAYWSLKHAQKCSKRWAKNSAKFPATTPSCSIVKIGRLDDSSLDIIYPQASPGEGQSLRQKEKQREKRKGKKISKVEKP